MHKVLGAVLAVAATTLVAAGTAQAASVPGTDVTYSLSADFDKGTAVNVNSLREDALRLNEQTSTFPFIWVALSLRCTIAKVNTETGEVLGEFRTVSDSASRGCRESSRTTVGLDGSVWVGHRGPGGVTHVGLQELNQCVDRNGNGTIETSSGYADVKAWTGSDSVVANAADECILHHVDTDALGMVDTRHMSIDANGKLWVGDFSGGSKFIRVDAFTGEVETEVLDLPCGGYGGLIDEDGVIWSAHGASNLLRWDTATAPSEARCLGIPAYGLALAPDGHVWATDLGSSVYKIAPDGTTVLGPIPHGNSSAQGLAVAPDGDVWVSSSLFCGGGCSVGHLKGDGTLVGTVPTPTAAGSTGVAIDAEGKVWIANRNSSNATRIDPEGGPLGCGGTGCGDGTRLGAVDLDSVPFPATSGRPAAHPYNYSDMTGAQLLGSTAPQGRWSVVQDAGTDGARWGRVRFNTEPEAATPPGTTTTVEARAADTEAGLGGAAFQVVQDDVPFDARGRFLEVRVTLLPDADGNSPVFSDLRVCTADLPCRPVPDDQPAPEQVAPAQTGGSAPAGGVAGAQEECLPTSGFASVAAVPQDRGRLRLAFVRRVDNPVGVDVFRVSRGRQVLPERLVARFRDLVRSFTWDGRANRAGRQVGDGVYFVRLSVEQANGRVDRRRITLMREDGRWSVRPPHYRRESCGLLTAYKLLRPAFAGPTRRGLGIAFQLSAPAQVLLEVLRGDRVVRTIPARTYLAERTIRLSLPDAQALPSGDYRFRLTAIEGDRRVVAILTSRKL